jgi:drug/metabolite transporter (DMT)-like permease
MKIALTEIPVWSFRATCVLGGTIGLFCIARLSGLRIRPAPAEWRPLAITALLNVTLWNIFIAYGIRLLPASRAAILAYTMPLWTVLLSHVMLGEPINRRRAAALLLGGLGLLVLMGDEMLAVKAAPMGALMVISGALSWAFGTILMKKHPVNMPTTSFTAWQFLLGGLPLVAGALIMGNGIPGKLSISAMLAVLYNILVSFTLCHWAWFRIVKVAPAGVAALSTMLIPVIGVISSMLVLGETPRLQEVLALGLVLASLAKVFGRKTTNSAVKV